MPNDNEYIEGKQVNLGADHLTFEGGGGILNKKFLQGYSEQKTIPGLTNWGQGGGNILPQYLMGKMLQNSMIVRDRFDQSQKISWFDFQGLV
jgi:hypothetical protein